MEAVAKIPLSLAERLEYKQTIRTPADWEEFLLLLTQCDYRIEYAYGQIISFMGYASENHEKIVLNIAFLLRQLLDDEQYELFGSNLALHVPDSEKTYFNADCTVVRGKSEKVRLSKNMYAVANPILLVEVLSASTLEFDLMTKGPLYREIPGLRQLLLIDSEKPRIVSFERDDEDDAWRILDHYDLQETFSILGVGELQVGEIYRKIDFSSIV